MEMGNVLMEFVNVMRITQENNVKIHSAKRIVVDMVNAILIKVYQNVSVIMDLLEIIVINMIVILNV